MSVHAWAQAVQDLLGCHDAAEGDRLYCRVTGRWASHAHRWGSWHYGIQGASYSRLVPRRVRVPSGLQLN